MPYAAINTNKGPAKFHYDISTPTNHSAAAIDPDLPTIFFIHATYISDEIFEPQFSDPGLRQFNLVTVQMRGYGETQGRIGFAPYTPREAADDIWNVMEVLALPRLHIFAISIGTSIALELASRHPQRFLSLTLCSPLSPVEDEMVRSGRLEVFDIWVAAHKFEQRGGVEVCVDVDESILEDPTFGALQILFNNKRSKMIDSITGLAVDRAKRRWTWSRENIQDSYKAVAGWYVDREPIPDEQLAKINCLVSIVHFQQDIGYPLKHAFDVATKLTSATVNPVYDIQGSHMGNAMNPKETNAILRQTVLNAEYKVNQRNFPDVSGCIGMLHTPFTDILAPYARRGEDEDDEDEDEDEDEDDEDWVRVI